MRSLIIEILLFDRACIIPTNGALLYFSWWAVVRVYIQIIGRSCAVTMRVTKADRQRNENGRWKANSGTRLRRDVVHGDICQAPEFVDRATVTARLRFSLLHSKTVTLSSQSSPLEVHGSPIRALLSRRIEGATLARCFVRSLYRKLYFTRTKIDIKCRH